MTSYCRTTARAFETTALAFTFVLAMNCFAIAQTSEVKDRQATTIRKASDNYTWDSLRDHWKRSVARGMKASYPTLKFDINTQVGDIGVGDTSQSLTILDQRGDDEFLVSVWETVPEGASAIPTAGPVFLFRRFDFSRVPMGGSLPAPGLCQVSGTYEYIDASGSQRSVNVVEPLAEADLPLPDATKARKPVVNQLRPKQSDRPSSPKKSKATLKPTVQQVAAVVQQAGAPSFQIRNWVRLNQYQNLKGKLLGVGSDAVWVRVGGGKTLRVPLQDLDPRDRNHALAKKEAILAYRRQKADSK